MNPPRSTLKSRNSVSRFVSIAGTTALPVTPAQLQPEQEGSYSLKVSAQDFASIRLAGLKADPQSSLIAYSSSQGKKRTPERLEPKTIVVKRAGKPGEFINTADNPGRIP
jgi:hypothetical protein